MNAEQIAKEISDEFDAATCKWMTGATKAKLRAIIGERIKPLVEDAERWSFVKAFNLHSGSPHMDGTYAFILGGSLGRAITVEEAIAARMDQRVWKGKGGDA